MQDFRRVRAWQRAQRFSVVIHRLLQTFPKKGYSRLKQQLSKSSESAADNIAEACGAATQPEVARFLAMAIRSTTEMENQLDRAHRFSLINDRRHAAYATEVQTIRKMTIGFRKSVVRTFDRDA